MNAASCKASISTEECSSRNYIRDCFKKNILFFFSKGIRIIAVSRFKMYRIITLFKVFNDFKVSLFFLTFNIKSYSSIYRYSTIFFLFTSPTFCPFNLFIKFNKRLCTTISALSWFCQAPSLRIPCSSTTTIS